MDDRKRVLYVVPRCASTGPLFVLRDIIRHCDGSEFDLRLVTLEPEIPGHSIWAEFSALLPCEQAPTPKREALLGRMGTLRTAIDRFRPHVVHSTGAMPDVAVSRICPQRQLATVHSDLRANYAYIFGRAPGLALAGVQMRAVRRARMAVTVSESLSRTYAQRYRFEAPFIRNGVEVGPRWVGDRMELRRQLGLPEDRTILVCAATFSELKNQAFLLKALAAGPGQGPLLLLLGDGETWQGLRDTYADAPNALLPGRVDNVREYLRAADGYVSASRSEGLPLSVLEALAEGLPVLLSDIPSHREIVSLVRTGGELFPLDDEDAFRGAMERFLDRDRQQARADARWAAEQHFSAQVMSLAYQRLYRSLQRGKGDSMSPVEISVVVPVYNVARYLGETLAALDRQSFPACEFILVDDGSTDGSAGIIDDFCLTHKRFRPLHRENGGEHRARLDGIRAARGRYIAFCDSDDLPLPDMLEELYAQAEAADAEITVCGFCREEMGSGRVLSREMLAFEPRGYAFPELWDVLPMVNPALWNKLFRAELLEHLLPLDQPPRVAPDLMFCCSLYPFVRRMAFVPEVLYRYRVRPNSAIAQVSEADVALARKNMLLVRDHALRENDSPEMRQYLADLAFIHFGWALLIRQVKGSIRSRAAVRATRRWLNENFPGYQRAGKSLLWNLRHRRVQFRALVGRWIFCAHLMGPFLVFYDLVTQKLKMEIKW